MSSRRRVLSTVTDTLTSDVVTTSTGVLNRSKTSKRPPQEAVRHQHARRRDVDDRDAALARQRGQRGPSAAAFGRDHRARRPQAAANSGCEPECSWRPPEGWCSDEAPWRRNTPARTLRRTTAAGRAADRARRADRRSACRRRRSRSESRRRRGTRRRSPPNSPIRRGRASS